MGMNEPSHPRGHLRRVGAVFVGLVAIVVLSMGADAVLHASKRLFVESHETKLARL
jgi:hypothetical protein